MRPSESSSQYTLGKMRKALDISMLNDTLYNACLHDVKCPSVHCYIIYVCQTDNIYFDCWLMHHEIKTIMIIQQEDFQSLSNSAKKSFEFVNLIPTVS